MTKLSQTIRVTGEVVELYASTPEEIVESYRQCQETIKAYEALKKSLQALAEPLIGARGTSEPINGFMFRQTAIQRMNYDKTVLRQLLDEDDFDLLLEPNKTSVDNFLKEHLEDLGDKSTKIRVAMVPVGNPYSVTKLEKLS